MADISFVPQQTDHSESAVSSMVAGFGQLNYVASCRSSTVEGASDVSPSHLFHFAYCTCRSFVVLGCCCACWFFVLVLCFACAAGIFLIIVADVSRLLNRSLQLC